MRSKNNEISLSAEYINQITSICYFFGKKTFFSILDLKSI